jgi:crotonyl-CoA reductase
MSTIEITEKRTEFAEALPETYKAAFVHADDIHVFDGMGLDRDVRRTIRVGEVPFPELAPDEVIVKVMASSLNFNTVWSGTFLPLPTHAFLHHLASSGGYWDARHLREYHQLGSDAAGIVVARGSGVRKIQLGDQVVVYPGWSDFEDPELYEEAVIAEHQKAWGYETNFGGLGEYCIVKSPQCMPKAPHLSWEEAASTMLCGMTAYRMLIGHRGAQMKIGDIVLVWGAAGGLGSYAIQLIKEAGGVAVGVVNSEEKERLVRAQGCDVVVRRDEIDPSLQGKELGKAVGRVIRRELGEDPHIVFEHVGQATFEASVFLVRKGGKVVTCGSSTGFMHTFDNRHLWMHVKKIIGSHGANAMEGWEFNRLVNNGVITPTVSKVYGLDDVAEAAHAVQANQHLGKVSILCAAEEEGLGIQDYEMRTRIGEEKLNLFRDV